MLQPRLLHRPATHLIGMRIELSLSDDRTRALWQRFRPQVREIENRLGNDFFSVQCYPPGLRMEDLTPSTRFERWAAVEVAATGDLPDGMEALSLPAGEYAVFIHRGGPATFPESARYFFGGWLPQSGYEADDRPHFEILGEEYRPGDPKAEEEVWVPVRTAR